MVFNKIFSFTLMGTIFTRVYEKYHTNEIVHLNLVIIKNCSEIDGTAYFY